jgi:hypothetical protein
MALVDIGKGKLAISQGLDSTGASGVDCFLCFESILAPNGKRKPHFQTTFAIRCVSNSVSQQIFDLRSQGSGTSGPPVESGSATRIARRELTAHELEGNHPQCVVIF